MPLDVTATPDFPAQVNILSRLRAVNPAQYRPTHHSPFNIVSIPCHVQEVQYTESIVSLKPAESITTLLGSTFYRWRRAKDFVRYLHYTTSGCKAKHSEIWASIDTLYFYVRGIRVSALPGRACYFGQSSLFYHIPEAVHTRNILRGDVLNSRRRLSKALG
jgi:hypothetical protein